MSEPPSERSTPSQKHRSLLERLTAFIFREPENREELLEALHDAHERNLLDADAMSMIEGVLQVSELRARDLMIPRSQMDVIDIAEPVDKWIDYVIDTAHSRFPVIEGSRDHVIGILLAKDLLRYFREDDFDVRGSLRPAVFIPESKPLNVLLRDFRAQGVARVQAFSLNAALGADLRRRGFFEGRSPMQFCVRARQDAADVFAQKERWHVVFGDSDMDR